MRTILFLFLFLLLYLLVPRTTSAPPFDSKQGRPIPPGVRQADKQVNDAPNEAPLPPKSRQLNAKLLQAEAAELAQLSSGIPQRIENVNKGQMPKDLNEQLKRIEKLAKHIRGEVYP